MDKVGKNHPGNKAGSFCHICGYYYCKECLNEGNGYFYCNNQPCYEKYKEELQSITGWKIDNN